MAKNQKAPNEQDGLTNKLLDRAGSVAEKMTIARKLDDVHLQIAVAAHSTYAKVEFERRARELMWYDKPLGRIAITVVGGALTAAVIHIIYIVFAYH